MEIDASLADGKILEVQSGIGKRLSEVYGLGKAEKQEAVTVVTTDILDWLRGWTAIAKRSVFAIGGMLYWSERFWGMLTPLHVTYETFDEFARNETCLQYSTYRAWIAIYRTFVVNDGQNPRVVAEGPEAFLDVPVGKLERAVAKVRRNQMDEHHWDALFDEQVSDREFYHTISTTPEQNCQDGQDFVDGTAAVSVKVDDKGDIMLWRGKLGIRIGWFDMVSQDAEVRDAVDGIIARAGLK